MADFVKLPMVWLLGAIFTLFCVFATYQNSAISAKLDTKIFDQFKDEHEKSDTKQFAYISKQLDRIEARLEAQAKKGP